jgi:hypothetical protein
MVEASRKRGVEGSHREIVAHRRHGGEPKVCVGAVMMSPWQIPNPIACQSATGSAAVITRAFTESLRVSPVELITASLIWIWQ